MTDDYEKILIGNVRGLAATIKAGNVTMKDPGTDPKVTNSGTNTEAVLDFEIPRFEVTGQSLYASAVTNGFTGTYDDWLREYLEKNVNLPWCWGYFRDRSLAANSYQSLFAEVVSGDASMVENGVFVVPKKGIYLLIVNGGRVPTGASVLLSSLWLNFIKDGGAFTAEDATKLLSHEVTVNTTVFNTTSTLREFETGDFISANCLSASNQSTIHLNGQRPSFAFTQIR